MLYSGFILGTGPGSTAAFYTSTFNTPGTFLASTYLAIAGNPGDIITAMVVAYDGPTYQLTTHRGHSPAFVMPLASFLSPWNSSVGSYMSGFQVGMPEPSTFALAGLGSLALWVVRRKRA
jgi:hypothetical protein